MTRAHLAPDATPIICFAALFVALLLRVRIREMRRRRALTPEQRRAEDESMWIENNY